MTTTTELIDSIRQIVREESGNAPSLMSTAEAARYMRMPVSDFWKHVVPYVPCVRVHPKADRRYDRTDLDAFKEQRKVRQ